ncbi:MAG: AraC family transcriptional regulator [Lentisphaeria bacterium]|nr:AraC family transcriptional regulator [Lentisphaeria bacterium]
MKNAEIQLIWNKTAYRMEWEGAPDRIYHQTFMRNEHCNVHTHPSYHLILVTKGACSVNIDGYPPVVLPQNSLLMINPNHRHQFIFDKSDVCVHNPLIWRFCDENGNLLTEPLQKLMDGSENNPAYELRVLSAGEAGDFIRMHREMEQFFWSSSDYVKSSRLFSLMILGIDMLWRWKWQKNDTPSSSSNNGVIKEKILFMIDMYFRRESFSARSIADELDRSLHYLNSVMLKETGSGVASLLRKRRLKYAIELLKTTNAPVKTIAHKCGFASAVYFSELFKHENGMTASEYRKQYNNPIQSHQQAKK